MRMRLGVLGTLIVLVAAACGPPYVVSEIGLATGRWLPVRLDDGTLLVEVDESEQGGTDLNGDGVVGDRVLHAIDPNDNIVNLGLSIAMIDVVPVDTSTALFSVSEIGQNVDLDGNGMIAGEVLHLFESPTTVTNLGVPGEVVASGGDGSALTVVSELRLGVDLNGDGDMIESVHHLWTPSALTNLGVASGSGDTWALADGSYLYPVSEVAQGGQDLDGDGNSTNPGVYHRTQPDLTTQPELSLPDGSNPRLTPDRDGIVVTVDETQAAVDLNGDGDLADDVPHRWNLDGSVVNSGYAGSVRPTGGAVHFARVDEGSQGDTDLNGDGDTDDRVAHLWDSATGTLLNLGVAGTALEINGDHVALTINECEQGEIDLNGNGRSEFVWDPVGGFFVCDGDDVAAAFDRSTGQLTTTGLALRAPTIVAAGDGFAFPVPEASQGGDINGIGGSSDVVLFHWSPTTGLRNWLLPIDGISALDGDVATRLNESDAGHDLDGDGDADGYVVSIWDPETGFRSTQTAMTRFGWLTLHPDGVVYEAEEWQESADLNGDGDTVDTVMRIARPESPD